MILVGGCLLVGIGVGLALRARLGSDGYSTVIYGVSEHLPLPYAVVNWAVASLCVAGAWTRGVRPRAGTLVHPIVVGSTVDVVLQLPPATSPAARICTLGAGLVVLCGGVALYLGAALGSGPFESLAFALTPLSFRSAYVVLQAAGTALGWLLGAPVGPGSVLIVFGVGPIVSALRRRFDR